VRRARPIGPNPLDAALRDLPGRTAGNRDHVPLEALRRRRGRSDDPRLERGEC
jgi:hypothetical protein